VVADLDPPHLGADRLDHAGALMAHDGREHLRRQHRRDGQVGVAQAGRHHPDQHLVRPRVVDLDLGEHELVAGLGERRLGQ
jgi:hypothetical protein